MDRLMTEKPTHKVQCAAAALPKTTPWPLALEASFERWRFGGANPARLFLVSRFSLYYFDLLRCRHASSSLPSI